MKETIIQLFSEILSDNEDLDTGAILQKIVEASHTDNLSKLSDSDLLEIMTEIQAELELN